MLEQLQSNDSAERKSRIGKAVAGLHTLGARWPWIGNTVSILPQVTGGSFGIKELAASTGAAANAIAVFAGSIVVTGVNLVCQAAVGGWPFERQAADEVVQTSILEQSPPPTPPPQTP